MKQALTLYTNPLTSNGIKMTLMFNAIEYQPEIVEIQLHQREQKSAQFLQINPAGKIPVLVDGAKVLTESNAILYYLANKFHSPLWPKQVASQSEILKWLFFQAAQWSEATTPFAHRRVVLPRWGFYARVDLEADFLMHFHEVMQSFNDRLSDKQYLVNEQLSIADLSLASNLIFASESQMPLDDYPNVSRWLSCMSQTAWWQKTKQSLVKSLT